MVKYIQPGKPTQNAFVERFNGSYLRGVLNKYIFENLDQVREQTRIWMNDYNNDRPHDGLEKMAPIEYAKINSSGANPRRIKNNNYIKVLEVLMVLIWGSLQLTFRTIKKLL